MAINHRIRKLELQARRTRRPVCGCDVGPSRITVIPGRVARAIDELMAPPLPRSKYCKVCRRATLLVLSSPDRHEIAEAD